MRHAIWRLSAVASLAHCIGRLCLVPTVKTSPNLSHPLDSAFERVNRASEHFSEFKRRVAVWNNAQYHAAEWQFDPQDPSKISVGLSKIIPMPLRIGTLLGEICYNLRTALDYVIFELAKLDSSGIPQDGTQFPIEDAPKGFAWRQKRGWLKGLNSAHIAAIEALQPYNACNWTKALRDISNPDKHRNITNFAGDMSLKAIMRIGDIDEAFESAPGTVSHKRHPVTGEEVYVKLHLTTEVQLRDGTPVIETLEIVKLKISETLEAFKPEFK
jgi:hypothetical protein